MGLFWWLPFGKVPEISATKLDTMRKDGAVRPQIIDVRTSAEWRSGHIAGAIHVPITEFGSRIDSLQLDRTRPIVAICRSAHRSIPAVRLLQRHGFRNACQLQGGMLAWRQAELPVEGDDSPDPPMRPRSRPRAGLTVPLESSKGDEPTRWDTRPIVAFIIGVGCMAVAGAASAAESAAGPAPLRQFALGQVFALLFLMLGPFKIIGPFFKVTRGADARLTRQIAVWATIFSALALLIAGFLGESILSNYGIPLPILALAGGIILFLVALKNVLEQFETAEPRTDDVAVPPAAA